MATIDFRDANLHVPICRDFQKFLRLAVRVNSEVLHFQCRAVPAGLASSPRIFPKFLAEALAPLRVRAITVIPYLDDLLFVAQFYQQLEENLQEAQDCIYWRLHMFFCTVQKNIMTSSVCLYLPAGKIYIICNQYRYSSSVCRMILRAKLCTFQT